MDYNEMAQEKAREERRYQNAKAIRDESRADVGKLNIASPGGGAGLLGAAMSTESYGRTLLELKRDQLRRQADDIQKLLDVLPSKLPEGVGQALLQLIGP